MTNNDDPNTYKPHFEPLVSDEPARTQPLRRVSRRPRPSRKLNELVARFGKPVGIAVASLGVFTGAVVAYQSFGPIHTPSALTDPLDDVLGFALLDADFNRLPLEKRIELAKEIAARIRSMNGRDSTMLAAFAAGIAGKARDQLADNLSGMMVDLFDSYAQKYTEAPDDQKENLIESSLLELLQLQHDLDPAGVTGDTPPQEELAQMKKDATDRAQKRTDRAPSNVRRTNAEETLAQVEKDVNTRTNPAQRARTVRFMRDTVRYLRGQSIKTGKPKRE